ncbi:MAG: DNA primase [Kiloniellales bacterium]
MAFPTEFLDDIRARVPLAGVIGRRVNLRKRGREHTGLCPFHNEKTPSFTVSEEKGFFHCFGCGAHGDVIGFVMRAEGLSFPEAVERLAADAGLQVPRASPEERAAHRRSADLLDVLEAAAAWFEERLRAAEGAEARAYLTGRGLTPETVSAFRLGYAPDRRGILRAALNARGMDDERLAEAGLIKRPEGGGGPRDYFFNRIIFPITDRRGRVIAFGGRALGESPAKYLNSPETPLFQKGRVLYNLSRARQAAHDTGELIVAEGYMDVIALSQAGFPAAVAALGTAITEAQIEELWRLAEEPLLCLDGDQAGRRAGYRAAERALGRLRPGRSLRFALLPSGEDPDSLLRGQGAKALRLVLDGARPLSELLWLLETEGRRFDTPERQAGLQRALEARIGQIPDSAVQAAYREALDRRFLGAFGYGAWGLARRGGAPPARARGRNGRGWRQGRPGRWDRSQGRPGALKGAGGTGLGARQAPALLRRRRDQVLLSCLVNHTALIAEFAESLAEIQLSTADFSAFGRELVDSLAREPDLDSEGLKCHLRKQGYSEVLSEILSPEVYVHGRFARADGPLESARGGVQEILEEHRRRKAASEAEAAAQHLAQDMTAENLAKLEAKQRPIRENDETREELALLDEAATRDQN